MLLVNRYLPNIEYSNWGSEAIEWPTMPRGRFQILFLNADAHDLLDLESNQCREWSRLCKVLLHRFA